MGLDKAGSESATSPLKAALAVPGAVAFAASGVAFAGDAGRLWLRYDRDAIAHGEFWRLVTGHFAHLGTSHLLLNLAGLLLVAVIVGPALSPANWAAALFVSIIGIDAAFWMFEPGLEWYVGLSGVLHGLLAAGIVAGWRSQGAELRWLAVLLVAKLGYEQLVGPLPGSGSAAGGPVVTAAHLYGAVAGAAAGLAAAVRRRRAPI